MKSQLDLPRRAFPILVLLVFVLAGHGAGKSPFGSTIDGIEVGNFRWISSLVLDDNGKFQEECNFRVTIRSHLTNAIHDIQLRTFFYDAQERPLTNVIVKYRPVIPAGFQADAAGYVAQNVRESTRVPAKNPSEAQKQEAQKREATLAELAKKAKELTNKIDELMREIGQRDVQIAKIEQKPETERSPGDLEKIRQLQGEKAELERQISDLSVLRSQITRLKDELSIARRLEWIRMGIYGGQGFAGGTNSCRLEFEVLSFDVVD